jgi:hypothetical protein
MTSIPLDSDPHSGPDESDELDFTVRDHGLMPRAAKKGAYLTFTARSSRVDGRPFLEYQADLFPGAALSLAGPDYSKLRKQLRSTLNDTRLEDAMRSQTHAFDKRYRHIMEEREICDYAASQIATTFKGLYDKKWGDNRVVPGPLIVTGTVERGLDALLSNTAASNNGNTTLSVKDCCSAPPGKIHASEILGFLKKATRIPHASDRAATWGNPSHDIMTLPSPRLTQQEAVDSVAQVHTRLTHAFCARKKGQSIARESTDNSTITGSPTSPAQMNQSGYRYLFPKPTPSQDSMNRSPASGPSYPGPADQYAGLSSTGVGNDANGQYFHVPTQSGQWPHPSYTMTTSHDPSSQVYPFVPPMGASTLQPSGNFGGGSGPNHEWTDGHYDFYPNGTQATAPHRAQAAVFNSSDTYGQGGNGSMVPQGGQQGCQGCFEGFCALHSDEHFNPNSYWGQ